MRVLDVGCGLGEELGYLASKDLVCTGVDLSKVALERAAKAHPHARVVRADVLRLPFEDGSFDVLLDRGCLHYLRPEQRAIYANEARRVLGRPGRLLLRACLTSEGRPNGLNRETVADVFSAWQIERLVRRRIPADARMMDALMVRLSTGP
jgi:ubiquinone/menaquinone biosynthesis C-methylase UbiE